MTKGCTCVPDSREWRPDGACATCGQRVLEAQLAPVILQVLCGGTGLVLFRNPAGYDETRKVRYGLAPGSGDYVGLWSGVTPAAYIEVEIKTPLGRLSKEQIARRDLLVRLRSIYAVVRSGEQAAGLLAYLRGGPKPEFVFS